MARTPSTMAPLGSPAPSFALPDPAGTVHSLSDFADAKAVLVAFWCNHCPFVKHIRGAFVDFAREYMDRGLAIVAINSNDADAYSADSPEAMAREAAEFDFPFPYLVDADQDVARAYHAACTPDFFLYGETRSLVYRGQFDGSRPSIGVAPTGQDLRAACDAVLSGGPVPADQVPSLGCNIKWKPGGTPDYMYG